MLLFFDFIRRKLSGEKTPDSALTQKNTRNAIDVSEKYKKCRANTLIGCLHEVTSALRERPPQGFSWTSHSLPRGAATTAYNIGVTLHKIKYFGGWSTESSVVLDYIDPTVLVGRS
jgi:hypothetical protein